MQITSSIERNPIPEFHGNGDCNTTEDLINILREHLDDNFILIGMFDIYGDDLDDSHLPYYDSEILFIGNSFAFNTLKVIETEEYESGFILSFKDKTPNELNSIRMKLFDILANRGSYPLRDSNGDDHMVSCLPLFDINHETKTFVIKYWYDDSTR